MPRPIVGHEALVLTRTADGLLRMGGGTAGTNDSRECTAVVPSIAW
jgi:hypothetical protein